MKGVNEYTESLRLLRYDFKSWYFYKEWKYEKLIRVKNKGIWRDIAAWFPGLFHQDTVSRGARNLIDDSCGVFFTSNVLAGFQ